MTFFGGLERFASNRFGIDTAGNEYTYRELVDNADQFAAALPRDRKRLLFVLCNNNIESVVGYIGALRAGQAVVLLAADTEAGLMANLLELYRPDFLWKPALVGEQSAWNYRSYALVPQNVERSVTIHPDLALLLSTSGSTGSPKMVRLTAANVDANASSIAEYLKLDVNERPITALPMHYSFGLSIINSHLRVGATLLLTNESIITRSFWDFFRKYEATSFSGVPYTYEMLRRLKFFEMSLPSLRTMTQAGGKLTPRFAQEFAEFSHTKGFDFVVMYGQTEATARISYLPPKDNLTKFSSIGIAIPRGELSLIDLETGKPVTTPNVDGELVYRGPNVMMGYAEQEFDLVKGDELHGTLVTGDIARFDADGFFYITGRKKRFIKIYGNRVNLDEIEHYLKSLGYVSVCGGKDDLLCIATTDKGKAEEIRAVVTGKYGFHHSVIKAIEVSEIIKNPSGKIQYQQMFAELLA